jgi:sterol desaturase/sphingolipid hydroxylase (fatty acid hydroxylase superfamily)
MSFHPAEAVTGAVIIPLLLFIVPIHPAALLVVLLVMTVMGVTNHMGWEIFPDAIVHGRAGGWLITASHHERHHRDYQCNYGLYFRAWDKVCGTDKGLGDFARGAAAGGVGQQR